jgi:hypothetical protein
MSADLASNGFRDADGVPIDMKSPPLTRSNQWITASRDRIENQHRQQTEPALSRESHRPNVLGPGAGHTLSNEPQTMSPLEAVSTEDLRCHDGSGGQSRAPGKNLGTMES